MGRGGNKKKVREGEGSAKRSEGTWKAELPTKSSTNLIVTTRLSHQLGQILSLTLLLRKRRSPSQLHLLLFSTTSHLYSLQFSHQLLSTQHTNISCCYLLSLKPWEDPLVARKNTPTKELGPKKKTNASSTTSSSMVKAVGDPSPKLLVTNYKLLSFSHSIQPH